MKTYRDFSALDLARLQHIYDKKTTLSVEETGIWLGLNPAVVRKYLKQGKIIGKKMFGTSVWRIDVNETKKRI